MLVVHQRIVFVVITVLYILFLVVLAEIGILEAVALWISSPDAPAEEKPAIQIEWNETEDVKRIRVKPKKINVYDILPKNSVIEQLLKIADQLDANSKHPFVVITAGEYNYLDTVLNWIAHMERLGVDSYIVLCFDIQLYTAIGPQHGVLVENYLHQSAVPKESRLIARNVSRRVRTNKLLKRPKINRTSTHNLRKISQSELIKKSVTTRKKRKPKEVFSSSRRLEAPPSAISKAFGSFRAPLYKSVFSRYARALPPRREFSVMSISKYEVILQLLLTGRTVVWSDADCVWLKVCSVQHFSDHAQPTYHAHLQTAAGRPRVDILGQQGLTPVSVSNVIGSSLCGGLFLVNPTNISIQIISDVRNNLIQGSFFGKSFADRCDQTILNTLILYRGGYNSVLSGSRPSFKFGINGSRTVEYTYDLGHRTLPDLNWDRVESYVAGLKSSKKKPILLIQSEGITMQPLSVGLLPYHLFPRGHPIIPKAPVKARKRNSSKISNRKIPTQLSILETINRVLSGKPRDDDDTDSTEDEESEVESVSLDLGLNMTISNSSSGSDTEDRYAAEWKLYQDEACCWHMLTNAKSGAAKRISMIRDGVYINRTSALT